MQATSVEVSLLCLHDFIFEMPLGQIKGFLSRTSLFYELQLAPGKATDKRRREAVQIHRFTLDLSQLSMIIESVVP